MNVERPTASWPFGKGAMQSTLPGSSRLAIALEGGTNSSKAKHMNRQWMQPQCCHMHVLVQVPT